MSKIRLVIALVAISLTLGLVFKSKPAEAQYYMGNACCTPPGWCYLRYPMAMGAMCYCPGVYGPITGQVCVQ
jgi:hypothetical protein